MIHIHRWRPHEKLVMWDRCKACGKERIGRRWYLQKYQGGGMVYTLYAERPPVRPFGSVIEPPRRKL